jgi:MFS family permease
VTIRVQRVAVGTIFAVHGGVQGTFATRIPAISEHLHLSAGTLGLALFMPSFGSLALMPFTGGLIHRIGPRRATHLLLALWCLALVLPAFAGSLPVLCMCLLVFGAVCGMADIAMNAQGVELERRAGRSVMSSLHGLWSVGGFAAAGIGSLAAHADVDVRVHFAVVSAVLLVLGQVMCRLLPADPPATEAADADRPPRFALPTGIVLVVGVVAFCAVFAEVAGSDWAAVYLRDVLGAGHATAAFGYGVFAFAMAVCRLTGDRAIRRLGPARTVRIGALLGMAGAALIVWSPGQPVAMIGFGLLGIGVAVVVPIAFAVAGRLPSAGGAGRAIAGVATIAYGAGLAAPGAIGGIASLSSLRVSFVLVGVLVTAVMLAAGVLRGRATDPDTHSDAEAIISTPL